MNNNTTAQIVKLEEHRPIVKADIENGYDRLAHTLTNALAMNDAKLSGCEYQIVHAIISKTYRFHKKVDWIAICQLEQMTGMGKAHISKLINKLLAKKVIVKNNKEIGINTTVSEWKVIQSDNNQGKAKLSNRTSKVIQLDNENIQSDNKYQPIRPPHKKETITKEIITKEKRVTRKRSPTQKQISLDTLPDFISSETIQSFIEHRKTMKKPFTDNAFKLFVNQLVKHHNDGYDTTALMEMAIMSNWQMVYPKPEQKRQSSNSQFGKIGQSAMDMMNKMEFN